MRIRLPRAGAVVATVVLLGVLSGCATTPDPLDRLAGSTPVDLAVDGQLLRRGPASATVLAGQLGLDADAVRGSLSTAAPALRVLLVDGAGDVPARLRGRGFTDTPVGGRTVLTRPPGVEGLVGVPAVAVQGDLVAVGSVDQLAAWLGGTRTLVLPPGVLEAAAVALVAAAPDADDPPGAPAGAAGAVPPHTAAVLTVEADGERGRLALQLRGEGTQDDAVALDVRVRTAGPLGPDGRPLLEPAAPLTEGDVVGLSVRWRGDAERALLGGLSTGLLDFLGG